MTASDPIPTDEQKQFELPLEGSSFITEVAWASSPLFRAKLLARIAMHRQKASTAPCGPDGGAGETSGADRSPVFDP